MISFSIKVTKIIILITGYLLLVMVNTEAQSVEFTKSNFSGKMKDLKYAKKEISIGDNFISKGYKKYQSALIHYLKADSVNSKSALLNYKIGKCYLNITMEKYKAISYLEKAYKLNPMANEDLLFLLGEAYHLNYEFDKAIEKFMMYKQLTKASSFDKVVDKKIEECNTAKEMIKHPVDVMIENIGPVVNSKYPDYSPIINAKETMMIFTSRRPNTTGGQIALIDEKYYEDIYITYYDLDSNKWTEPENPKPPVNSDKHDATVGLSPDGNHLLIYKSNHGGDIYESDVDSSGNLTAPVRLPAPINSSSHESVASFSPDGKIMYFCSDREEDSYGGHDIFMSKQDSKGKWGPAINLGPKINTQYDEISVFMMADGKTLYFSSNGHNTMGGFDIFKTVYENGEWSDPVNLGYPINTPDDEVHFSISANGQHGYFASARPGGLGDLDIYRVTFLGVDKPLKNGFEELLASSNLPNQLLNNSDIQKIKGHVLDAITLHPISAKVTITDNETKKVVDTLHTEPNTGNYFSEVPTGKSYDITIISENYIPYIETIPVDKNVNKTIFLLKKNKPLSQQYGYIFDAETKQPVCNAAIVITEKQTNIIKDKLLSDCNTGKYHTDAPDGKFYDISVNATGYLPVIETVLDNMEVNRVIYLLKPTTITTTLTGNVYDAETKKPVCAKLVIKNDVSKSIDDSLYNDCNTGKYFSYLPKGKKYTMKVTSPGYIPYVQTIQTNDELNINIFISKGRTMVLNGEVLDAETKEPVCSEILIREDESKTLVDGLTSDCKTGHFSSKLAKGTYYVVVSSKDYIPYFETITVSRNINRTIYIRKRSLRTKRENI